MQVIKVRLEGALRKNRHNPPSYHPRSTTIKYKMSNSLKYFSRVAASTLIAVILVGLVAPALVGLAENQNVAQASDCPDASQPWSGTFDIPEGGVNYQSGTYHNDNAGCTKTTTEPGSGLSVSVNYNRGTYTASWDPNADEQCGRYQNDVTWFDADGNVVGGGIGVVMNWGHDCGEVIPPPDADIKANGSDGPITIDSGTSATVSWTSENTVSCTVNPGSWTGTSGSELTPALTAAQTYSLNCIGENGQHVSDSVTINVDTIVINPPTADIKANGSDGPITIPSGTSADIHWTSTLTDSCTVTPGGWTGTSGSHPSGNLTGTQTYTLNCTGPGGTATDSVTVNVVIDTECVPTTVSTIAASNVTQNSATITGLVSSGSEAADAYLEYGTTQTFGNVVARKTVAAGTSEYLTANLTNLQPNTTYYFRIVGRSDCNSNSAHGDILTFTTPATPTITADIKANGSDTGVTIPSGTAATLSWTSSGATACTVQPGSLTGISNSGVSTGILTHSVLYTLTCTGAAGTATDTVPVNVTIAPLINADIKANGSDGPISIPAGTSATLSWTSNGATSCTVNPGGLTGTSNSGVSTGNLQNNTTYTLTCTGAAGTATDTVTVNVTTVACTPVSASTIAATNVTQTSATITALVTTGNQSATARLEYGTTSSFGTTLASQTIPANTSQYLTANLTGLQPNTTYYFRVVATSPCNTANGDTLNFTTGVVNTQITADIKANGQDGTVTVAYNTSANITWTSSGATQCTVTPGNWTGLQETVGRSTGNITGTITYTLLCTNATQSQIDTVTVTPTGQPNLPTVTITPNPSVINQGQSSVLTWYSTNADQCWASNGPWSGNKAIPSGSETVSPAVTTTYTITCSNQSGTAQANATVIVINNQSTVIPVTKLVRNLTLGQTNFQQTVEAQGLDQLEFEIRVRNTDSQFRTITVQDILPQELFYVTGSTSVNGQYSQDGITSGGLTLSFGPNEEKVIRFRTTVFSGVSQRTITNQATASGQNGGFGNGFANVDLRTRGTVLGVSDISTGPEDSILYAIGIGLLLATVLFAALKRTGAIDGQVRRAKRGIEDVLAELQRKAQVSHEASRAFRSPLN